MNKQVLFIEDYEQRTREIMKLDMRAIAIAQKKGEIEARLILAKLGSTDEEER